MLLAKFVHCQEKNGDLETVKKISKNIPNKYKKEEKLQGIKFKMWSFKIYVYLFFKIIFFLYLNIGALYKKKNCSREYTNVWNS